MPLTISPIRIQHLAALTHLARDDKLLAEEEEASGMNGRSGSQHRHTFSTLTKIDDARIVDKERDQTEYQHLRARVVVGSESHAVR